MKRVRQYIGLFLVLICCTGELAASGPNQPDNEEERTEHIMLLTDRSFFVSGELLHFSAFAIGGEVEGSELLSRVLYVELITPNGNSLVRKKVNLETSGARGSIRIPTGISSGTYYLQAYTRWMRNTGPDAFSYVSLQIFEPFNETVLHVDTTGPFALDFDQVAEFAENKLSESLECKLDGREFQLREKVDMGLKWNGEYSSATICISVAKKGIHQMQGLFQQGYRRGMEKKGNFLPELRGVSLTGQVIRMEDGEPAAYATIYVSVLGEDRNFFSNYSDSTGRFYFSFPDYLGEKDLFVSSFHPEHPELELLIDRDFSNEVLRLPSYPIQLNDTLKKIVTEMSVNSQISQQYFPIQVQEITEGSGEQKLFYGHPTSTIMFDDFINLPRLEEYFVEVIPQVSVKRTRGVKQFVVLGEHPDLQIYQPLVMIDGVAIFDVEAVLDVSPRLIERVEIVNAPYIRGNVTFGGIISLISRNKDLGYIDLPSSGLLVNYQMLDAAVEKDLIDNVSDPRLPDVRNTLYWNPGIRLQPGGEQNFSFSTSDTKGEYEVLLRGIDEKGNYFSRVLPFTVE